MRYLTVTADYRSTGIKDDYKDDVILFLDFSELPVSKELWDRLQDWVEEYSKIIPLSSEERKSEMNVINELDKEGIRIAKLFREELGHDNCKIKYYSEGLLKYCYF